MTDSEKLDLLITEMQGIKSDTQELKQKVSGLDEKVTNLEKDMVEVKKDMIVVKADLKQLQKDSVFILDEVERVHGILDVHKADKSAHNNITVIK